MADEGSAVAAKAANSGGDAVDAPRAGAAWLPFLLVAFSALCWSGNHILGRAVAGHVPPLQLSFVRWLLPVLVLWPLARGHLRADWPAMRRSWGVILLLSITGGTIFSALQYVGLQLTYALNVSVLNSLAPVMIAVASAVLFGDRLSWRQALGIAISLCGVLAIVARGAPQNLAVMQLNWGDVVIFLNMGVWGVYSACLRLRPPIHWLSFLFVFAAISALTSLPAAALEHAGGQHLQPTWTTVLSCLYVALFPGVAAMATWNRGVEMMGANRAGACLHLVPVYSTVLASLLLGERLMSFHIAGFALILAGVVLAARPAPRGASTGR